MLITIFFIWLLIALIISVFDLKASLGLMIAYLLLVPYSSFKFSFISIEFNYMLLAIFCVFLVRWVLLRKESFDLTIIKPFAIFVLFILVGSFFSSGVDFVDQLSNLRSFSIRNFLIPIMLWQVCKEKSDVKYFTKIIFFCLIIMCIYGIFCFIAGQNPYIESLSYLFKKQDNYIIFSQIERSGILGKIQSTTSHPMLWSLILCMMLFASYVFIDAKNSLQLYFIISLMLINLMISNVRTGIVSFILGMSYLFTHFSLRFKLFGLSIIFLVLTLSVDTSIFGKYQPFVDSMVYFTDQTKSISGSTLDTRLIQLGGAVSLWEQGGIIFGNGFGWCGDYYATYGDHPILLGFESIIFIIIIENGIMGIILYGFLFYSFFKINHMILKKTKNKQKMEYWVIQSFIIAYIIFIVITGLFGFNLFLIFLVLMFKTILFNKQTDSSYELK
jgi:hypothetical protein